MVVNTNSTTIKQRTRQQRRKKNATPCRWYSMPINMIEEWDEKSFKWLLLIHTHSERMRKREPYHTPNHHLKAQWSHISLYISLSIAFFFTHFFLIQSIINRKYTSHNVCSTDALIMRAHTHAFALFRFNIRFSFCFVV